jgi:hypothetical protein
MVANDPDQGMVAGDTYHGIFTIRIWQLRIKLTMGEKN